METKATEIPKSLRMPSLEGLETSLLSKRFLGNVLGVHGPRLPRSKQITDGFVRLIEKTVIEYLHAREKLNAFLREGYADDLFRAQDHFESCVQSLHRAVLYFERLRQFGFRGPDGSPFIPRPRDLEVLRDPVKRQIRRFRDLIEHLDADILAGLLPEHADTAIHLGWESARLSHSEIRYEDLARWIRQLHHYALLLSQVQLVVSDPSQTESTTV